MSDFPPEYLEGIELFNQGKYFEAHEVWESIWMRSQGEMRLFYQALIQAAAALLHRQNGNRTGAVNLLRASTEKFSRVSPRLSGLDVRDFSRRLSPLFEGEWRDTRRILISLGKGKVPGTKVPDSKVHATK